MGDKFTSEVLYLEQDGHNTVNKKPDIDKAATQLGHVLTVELEDGIARTLEWMKRVYL